MLKKDILTVTKRRNKGISRKRKDNSRRFKFDVIKNARLL